MVILTLVSGNFQLLAISMVEIKGGAFGAGSGGQGSAANLQNAGGASASLTAALAQKSQQRVADVEKALQKAQTDAAADAKANPATMLPKSAGTQMTVNSSPVVHDGLKSGWLEPYVGKNPNNSLKPGFDVSGQPVTDPAQGGTWSGASITAVDPSKNSTATADANYQANSKNYVNIKQTSQNAYLYWNQFNVGPKTTVNFDQSAGGQNAGQWIAFNKVMSASDPSHIFGQITSRGPDAQSSKYGGQVYILNQNGILFHAGSSVNVQSLVAAALPINPVLAGDPLRGVKGQGLANNSGAQFLFTALKTTQSQNSFIDVWDPGTIKASSLGPVVVERGATITTSAADNTGGRAALIGASVRNEGTISTPYGQTILASALQVGLVPHPSADATLRGMDVVLGKVADATGGVTDSSGSQVGSVINDGIVDVPLGAASLAGRSIVLNGLIRGTTSTSLNGRVDLLSSYNAVMSGYSFYRYDPTLAGGATGTIELGSESAIAILPDLSDPATTTGSLLLPSVVTMLGRSIQLDGADPSGPGQGAIVLAPGANLNPTLPVVDMTSGGRAPISASGSSNDDSPIKATLKAGVSLTAADWYEYLPLLHSTSFHSTLGLYNSGSGGTQGSIVVGNGAIISAAGTTGTEISASQDVATIQFRAAELANSPLQRESPVRGKNITIDLRIAGTSSGQILNFPTAADALAAYQAGQVAWIGSPYGDLSGYAGLIGRGIGQLTTPGGSIVLQAEESVQLDPNSVVNVSGGWVSRAAGSFSLSELTTTDGRTLSITKASPSQSYSGVSKLTIQDQVVASLIGASGGALAVTAPSVMISGQLYGAVVTGAAQDRISSTASFLPPPSSLSLSLRQDQYIPSGSGLTSTLSPYAPTISFSTLPATPADWRHEMFLPISILGGADGDSGFGSLALQNHDGMISVASSITLEAAYKGSVSFDAMNVIIAGSVQAAGGTISMTSRDVTYQQQVAVNNSSSTVFAGYGDQGLIQVSGSLSTAGEFQNLLQSSAQLSPVQIQGGAITLTGYKIRLESESTLDVSGSAVISPTGKSSYGSAGSIALISGHDTDVTSIMDGSLTLNNSSLLGLGGLYAAGGSLTLNAPAFRIGSDAPAAGVVPLSAAFFSQGGFTSFNLQGYGIGPSLGAPNNDASAETPGVSIAAGTHLRPISQQLRVTPTKGGSFELESYTPPGSLDPAVSLTLGASGISDNSRTVIIGLITVGADVSVDLHPQLVMGSAQSMPTSQSGKLSLAATAVKLDQGVSFSAPGGTISISGKKFPDDTGQQTTPVQTVTISSGVRLSTAGEVIRSEDPFGGGHHYGTVLSGGSINVSGGIVMDAASTMDVSGASGIVYSPANHGDIRVDTDGGTVTLSGKSEMILKGGLLGDAGGSSALGGTLAILPSRYVPPTILNSDPYHDISLTVASDPASMQSIIESDQSQGIYMSYVDAQTVMRGGFANLSLGGNVFFRKTPGAGDSSIVISMPLSIAAATGGVIEANLPVTLSAPSISLGQPLGAPLAAGDPLLSKAFGNSATPFVQPTDSIRGVSGTVSLHAGIINVGNSLFLGVNRVTLDSTAFASDNVIRGDGTLDMAGTLSLKAKDIFPVTDTIFNLIAYDTAGGQSGQISVLPLAGAPSAIPLSAVGTLDLYASSIEVGGNLSAPFGRVILGSGGATAPLDPVSGISVPTATSVHLTGGTVSVSSGGATIPYGIVQNGGDWYDPAGNLITSTGLPSRGVSISSSDSIIQSSSSVIDLSGGGNLLAYEWISGNLGTRDVAAANGSFAIMPGYSQTLSSYAPFIASLNPYPSASYSSSSLSIGEQIWLPGGGGLEAGSYTLLPSRYAVLPGAYLISPGSSSLNVSQIQNPDGSIQMLGYLFNGLDVTSKPQLLSPYLVTPPALVNKESQYKLSYASSSLPNSANAHPVFDAADISFVSGAGMSLQGAVDSQPATGGRGAFVELSASVPFLIYGGASPGGANKILLSSEILSSWNAGTLLIGGTGSISATGLNVVPTTSLVEVQNSSASVLSAQDLILAATVVNPGSSDQGEIRIDTGSVIQSKGSSSTLPITVSGDGTLLMLSGDPSATVVRKATTGGSVAGYLLGYDPNTGLTDGTATIKGGSLIPNSSGAGEISANTVFNVSSLSLSAARISLDFDGVIRGSGVLDLSGSSLLAAISSLNRLTLQSASSIDFHLPSGTESTFGAPGLTLTLDAGELWGGNGNLSLAASALLIQNTQEGVSLNQGATAGVLSVNRTGPGIPALIPSILTIGSGSVAVDGFSSVIGDFSGGVLGQGSGSVQVQGALTLNTPAVSEASGGVTSISAGGDLLIGAAPAGSLQKISSMGLGGSITLSASTISIASPITAHGGSIIAESQHGVTVTAAVDVSGLMIPLGQTDEIINAGRIVLSAMQSGNVTLSNGATLDLLAPEYIPSNGSPVIGNAGSLSISSPSGALVMSGGSILTSASGEPGGTGASLFLDQSSLSGTLSALESALTTFTQSQYLRFRSGDVLIDGTIRTGSFTLSADTGSITVGGKIDTSDIRTVAADGSTLLTGGTISLYAGANLTLSSGSLLDAHGENFNNAGQGGLIILQAGCATSSSTTDPNSGFNDLSSSGTLRVDAGTIDLHVAATSGLGQASGKLLLKAPQNSSATDIQMDQIGATITGASAIMVAGLFRQDASSTGTVIIDDPSNPNNLQSTALNNASSFMANFQTIASRINGHYGNIIEIIPAESIENSKGSLMLNSDWDLSLARYGPTATVLDNFGNTVPYSGSGSNDGNGNQAIGTFAGLLTLKSLGNITFHGSLSDGFGDSINPAANVPFATYIPGEGGPYGLYFAPVLPLLKEGGVKLISQNSWSYGITAGADTSASDPSAVLSVSLLHQLGGADLSYGSVKVGVPTSNSNLNQADPTVSLPMDTLGSYYQVIRTGTGNITVTAGACIELLNQAATVYTSGTQIPSQSVEGTFDLPLADPSRNGSPVFPVYGTLSLLPQFPQYTYFGGNVSLTAGEDIAHLQLRSKILGQYTINPSTGNPLQAPFAYDPTLTADSSRQLPVNWLMTRGATDGAGGWQDLINSSYLSLYGPPPDTPTFSVNQQAGNERASTTWWVNFSNFFEGVGALGGGNITMVTGGSIRDIDAAVPTQARTTSYDSAGNPLNLSQSRLIQTGGGNITIVTRGDIVGGVYYAERGNISLIAEGAVVTDGSRDVNANNLSFLANPSSSATSAILALPPAVNELPTSFLLGSGSVKVYAGRGAVVGPVANEFLLGQGSQNGTAYPTTFQTYNLSGGGSSFSVESLSGDVSLRTEVTLGTALEPAFQAWISSSQVIQGGTTAGNYMPWIRNNSDPTTTQFATDASLLPPSVSISALGGSLNLQGFLTLAPAPTGQLALTASGSLNGIFDNYAIVGRFVPGITQAVASVINMSDTSPGNLPSVLNPILPQIDLSFFFSETASYLKSAALLQNKLNLHDSSILHSSDTIPLKMNFGGDISGVTLYSPKFAAIFAGGNIRDVELAIQNVSAADQSVVAAGGSLTPYDPNSPMRLAAEAALGIHLNTGMNDPLAGDVQVSGPGGLEVVAGGTVNLGTGNQLSDGTGAGITSVGNARNPALPFAGAGITVMAGVQLPGSLDASSFNVSTFLTTVASLPNAARYYPELLDLLKQGGDPSLGGQDNLTAALTQAGSLEGISLLDTDLQHRLATQLFFIVLRDSGRDRGNPDAAGYGTYADGESAIGSLFPNSTAGDIVLNSRSIKTMNGGSIDLLTPGGGVVLSPFSTGTSLAPPGIVTSHGGAVDIYAQQSITLGIGRIFTLRGGDIMIWSERGNIAAGASSKTVASAPPTRVLIDPQSASVVTDLSGLATGGGIGSLQTIQGVPPANVDLIAVTGVIDAGDAGIRSSGNLHLAATKILNADNIAVLGVTIGASSSSAPAAAPPAAAPAPAAPPAAASTAAAANNSAAENASKNSAASQGEETPSVYSIDILGYGGSDTDDDLNKKAADAAVAPVQASL